MNEYNTYAQPNEGISPTLAEKLAESRARAAEKPETEDPEKFREKQQIESAAEYRARQTVADDKGKKLAEKKMAALRTFKAVDMDGIKPRKTVWAWKPYGEHGMPAGELVALVGKGGAAKSTILCWFTARISTGTLEGDWKGKPGNVLLLYREDSLEETIVPRLLAAGADMKRVKSMEVSFLGEEAELSLPGDCDALVQFIRDNDIVAVMYDPLISNVDVRDSNAQKSMRSAFERIRKVHETTHTLGLGLAHTRKAVAGSLLEGWIGSSEQGNVCRCAWGAIESPEQPNEFLMSNEKNNRAPKAGSLTYAVKTVYVEVDVPTSRIEFTGRSADTVSDILNEQMKSGGGPTQKERAKQWLEGYLADGEREFDEVEKAAKKEGHNYRTLRRAASALGVEFERHGHPGSSDQGSTWKLPERPDR